MKILTSEDKKIFNPLFITYAFTENKLFNNTKIITMKTIMPKNSM